MAEAIRWSKRTYHPKSEAIPKEPFLQPRRARVSFTKQRGFLIDQWAVSIGKWAFEQGKDKSSPTKLPPSNGKMD